MEIVILIIGIIVGAVIGILFQKSKQGDLQSSIDKLQTEKQVHSTSTQAQLEELKKTITSRDQEKEELIDKLRNLDRQLAASESNYKNLEVRYKEYKTEVDQVQETFKAEFQNLASEIVKKQSKDFSVQNESLLKPFRDQLVSFENTVNAQVKDSIEKAASFKEQLEQLKNLNLQISEEANNLTNALKGDNKQQGNWGELILEKVLDSSGLVKGSEYETQVSFQNVDDSRIQPDAIIYLPEEKHIIIDAKVSLVAYEKYVNEDDPSEKDKHLKSHILSVKTHVKNLSEKKYQTAKGISSPDFILLFVPIESSFGVAVREDVSLFNFAWEKNIVIVSPSTLLATLRTISSVWKQEKQNKNVIKIAEESGKLYDKFVGFLKDIDEIEKSFERTSKQFGEAQKKLHTGSGNIVGRIEKIKVLGAKATKSIDEKYLED